MTLEVLLVEDSPGDARLTQEAMREASDAIHLHVVSDGMEAMDYLNREGSHDHANRPDLILLDLNLPQMDGREVLAHIKADDELKTIPIVILAASDGEADIADSYRHGANCYLSKPLELEALKGLLKSISNFWLTKARLPRNAHG